MYCEAVVSVLRGCSLYVVRPECLGSKKWTGMFGVLPGAVFVAICRGYLFGAVVPGRVLEFSIVRLGCAHTAGPWRAYAPCLA